MAGAIVAGLLCVGAAMADPGRLVGHGGPIKGLAVSPDGKRALTASFDYALGLWDIATDKREAWLEGHRAAANAAAFLPDGRRAVSGGDDFDLILWDLESGEAISRLKGHQGKVISVAVSPDGTLAASASWDGAVGLWSLETPEPEIQPLALLKGHDSSVNAVVFGRDGRFLYSASADGTVRRWDVATRELVRIEASHGFGVNVLALDPQGRWLAYGATDGVVRVIDLDTGATLAEMTGDRRPILSLAVAPGGGRLAYGDGHGYISVAETASWTLEKDFHAAISGPIWALAFVDRDRLLAAGLDDFAAIWPVEAEVASLFDPEGPRRFHLDPETVSNGERQFARKCSVCHTLTPDSARRAGPSLYHLFGRRAGTLDGYSYSPALAGSDIVWSPVTLDKLFDLGPDHFTPGSKMPMQRITRPEDRADLITFLKAATDPEGAGAASGAKGEAKQADKP